MVTLNFYERSKFLIRVLRLHDWTKLLHDFLLGLIRVKKHTSKSGSYSERGLYRFWKVMWHYSWPMMDSHLKAHIPDFGQHKIIKELLRQLSEEKQDKGLIQSWANGNAQRAIREREYACRCVRERERDQAIIVSGENTRSMYGSSLGPNNTMQQRMQRRY